jgi:DNA-binding HxlR family transcriptional regulator
MLVYSLLEGPKRFSDLAKETAISRSLLIANLRALEQYGLVSRTTQPEVPPRVEYALTWEGMELRPLINNIYAWRQKFQGRRREAGAIPSTPLPAE